MPMQPYQVEQGDTIPSLAELYGTTVPEIMAANNLATPDRIYPGRNLLIPVEMDMIPGNDNINPMTNLEGGRVYRGGGGKGFIRQAADIALDQAEMTIKDPSNDNSPGKFEDVSEATLKSEFDESPISAIMKDAKGQTVELSVRNKNGEVVPWSSLSDTEKYDLAQQLQSRNEPGFRTKTSEGADVIDIGDIHGFEQSFAELINKGDIATAKKKLQLFRMQTFKDAIEKDAGAMSDAEFEKVAQKFDLIKRLSKYLKKEE